MCAQKSSDDHRDGLKVKNLSKYERSIPAGLSLSERKLYLNRLYEKNRATRRGSRRKKYYMDNSEDQNRSEEPERR